MSEANQDLFIAPHVNLTGDNVGSLSVVATLKKQLGDRWGSQQGKHILSRWKASGYDRLILDEMLGKFYGHTDLRGVPLAGETLRGVDLSNIDFYGANLEKTVFESVNLTNSWLSHSNLRGTHFNWSKMENVLIDEVDFDERTSFLGVDLKGVNFTLAALLHEHAISEQRIEHLRRRSPLLAWFLKETCDYGRSFHRFVWCCLALIVYFGFGFYLLPNALNGNHLWDSMYFSFITFIKASSKDLFVTSPYGQIWYMSEAAIGYIMLAVLVAIIIRKTIGR